MYSTNRVNFRRVSRASSRIKVPILNQWSMWYMLNNCREALIGVRSTLAVRRWSKRRKGSEDKLHRIINEKLGWAEAACCGLRDSHRQAFKCTASMTLIPATTRLFVPALGSRSILAQPRLSWSLRRFNTVRLADMQQWVSGLMEPRRSRDS